MIINLQNATSMIFLNRLARPFPKETKSNLKQAVFLSTFDKSFQCSLTGLRMQFIWIKIILLDRCSISNIKLNNGKTSVVLTSIQNLMQICWLINVPSASLLARSLANSLCKVDSWQLITTVRNVKLLSNCFC